LIITGRKGGRTRRAATNLAAHLYKQENDYVELAVIGNSISVDLKGFLADVRIMQRASTARDSYFHLTLNPDKMCSQAALVRVADLARLELDPGGVRPYALIVHGKARVGGSGFVHGHLILSNCDSHGAALKDRFWIRRLEKTARLAEHIILCEPPRLGRHHVAVIRALRKSAPDTAAWLVAEFGENPEKPRSAISSAARDRAKRLGIHLPKARTAVQKMWAETLQIGEFDKRLTRAGFEIAKGEKPGVWILRDKKSGLVLGAVDRLLRLKRQDVRNMMEASDEQKYPEGQSRLGTDVGSSRPTDLRSKPNNFDAGRKTPAVADADRGKGTVSGVRTDFHDRPAAERNLQGTAFATRSAKIPAPKGRSSHGEIGRSRAIDRLNKIDLRKLVALTAMYARPAKSQKGSRRVPYISELSESSDARDIWGIPIPKASEIGGRYGL
jgi:hypothetical protein